MWQKKRCVYSTPGSQEVLQLPLCSLGTSAISVGTNPASPERLPCHRQPWVPYQLNAVKSKPSQHQPNPQHNVQLNPAQTANQKNAELRKWFCLKCFRVVHYPAEANWYTCQNKDVQNGIYDKGCGVNNH